MDITDSIKPIHVFFTLITAALGVLGFLWRITKTISEMGMQMSMMWKDYCKRYGIENGKK